ncbi:MAG: hypothetical protein RB191_15450 [Terriglobia bacterium]|nr:hypothetical protein [Terriglobia bacterium]
MATIQKSGNDYLVKTGNGSRNSSGPSGRRKMRKHRIMREALADAAAKYGIVLWSSDQNRNRGTGQRARFDSQNHGHIAEAYADVKAKAMEGMIHLTQFGARQL